MKEELNRNTDNNKDTSKVEELALKYNKGDEIPVTFERKENTAGIFNIVLDGVQIGKFTIFDPSMVGRLSEVKVKQIGYVGIDDAFKNKGLGKQFYINLNEYLKNLDGSVLQSGDDRTIYADRVWSSLEKDGLAEKEGVTPEGKDSYKFKF